MIFHLSGSLSSPLILVSLKENTEKVRASSVISKFSDSPALYGNIWTVRNTPRKFVDVISVTHCLHLLPVMSKPKPKRWRGKTRAKRPYTVNSFDQIRMMRTVQCACRKHWYCLDETSINNEQYPATIVRHGISISSNAN